MYLADAELSGKGPNIERPFTMTKSVIAGQDAVIPPAHAETLVAALPQSPAVLYLPDAQHSNVQVFPAYGEALQVFFEDG